jgi:hypothetical protein
MKLFFFPRIWEKYIWKKKSSLVEKKKKRKDTPTNPFWVRNFFLKEKTLEKLRDKYRSKYLIL